jgi:mono/diheme cytochrome c family protein
MRFTLPASIALILTAAAVSINAGQSATSQSSVTFTKDIAPIFQNNCQVCHRPGSIAPMSLLTYADARPWARSIKLKVAAREMPPWFIDKNVGVQHFSNDRSLSDRDIETIPPTCRRPASSPRPRYGRSVNPM